MLGLVTQLLLSWIIIWSVERESLAVLGFSPTRRRVLQFFIFFAVTAVICASGFFLKMQFGNQNWKVNPDLTMSLVWKGNYWTMVSVLFEELIFRGVLLYILIKRAGARKGIVISAIGFGIYHWFSLGVLGDPMQMLIVFIITGAMGIVLAYGYAKTLSLYVPIAIHFGWNITQMFVFSQGPIGHGVLIPTAQTSFRTDSYLLYFAITFTPVILALLVNYKLLRNLKQEERLRADFAAISKQMLVP